MDACRSASRIITEHYFSISDAFAGLKRAVNKGAFSLEDENGKKLLSWIEKIPRLQNELVALVSFLVPHVGKAAIEYLNESGRIADLVKGRFEQGVPCDEELSLAHSKFQVACAEVIDTGPQGLSKNKRRES